mgnify:CR=1 FL=1|jgi:hypothetical protein
MNALKTVNAVNDGLTPVLLNGKLAFLSDAPNSRISFVVTPIKNETTKFQVDIYETLACFREDISVRLNHLKTATIEDEMFDKIDLTKLGDRDEQFLSDFAQSAQSVSSLSIEFNGFEYCTDIEIFAETTDIMALLQVNVGSSINSNLIHHTTDDEQETIRLAIGKYSPNKHARIVNLDNVLPVLLKDVTFGLKSAIESYL